MEDENEVEIDKNQEKCYVNVKKRLKNFDNYEMQDATDFLTGLIGEINKDLPERQSAKSGLKLENKPRKTIADLLYCEIIERHQGCLCPERTTEIENQAGYFGYV